MGTNATGTNAMGMGTGAMGAGMTAGSRPGAPAGSVRLTKGNRDRALMLRILDNAMQLDYALPWAHDRFSSATTHANSIYTSMNPDTWDANFLVAARKYLAEYRDPNLGVYPPESLANLERGRGFDVRRFGDSLYVTRLKGETRLKVGDEIVRLGSRTVAQEAYLGRFWLHDDLARPEGEAAEATGAAEAGRVHEREQWDLALASAPSVTLASGDTIELRWYPEPGAGCAEDATAAECASSAGLVGFAGDPEAHVLRVRFSDLDDPECLDGLLEALEDADEGGARIDGLVLDLRECGGEDFTALPELLCLCIDAKADLDELLTREVRTNYSTHNCERRASELRYLAQLEAEEAPETAVPATLGDLEAEAVTVEQMSGTRPVETFGAPDELGEPPHVVEPRGSFPVAILTDTRTTGVAEHLAACVKRLAGGPRGRCTLVGRPTAGSTVTENLCSLDIGDGFVFVYPISALESAAQDPRFSMGAGIEPHVYVPWTPESLTRDADLDAALAVLAERAR